MQHLVADRKNERAFVQGERLGTGQALQRGRPEVYGPAMKIVMAVAAVGAALIAGGCGSDSTTSTESASPATESQSAASATTTSTAPDVAAGAKLAASYYFDQIGSFVDHARGECADLGRAGDADGQELCLRDGVRKLDGDLDRLAATLKRAPLPAGECRKAGTEALAAARDLRSAAAGVSGPENVDRIKPARRRFNAAATSLGGRCS